jgi:alpha/beta superfamily hydrolase
MIGRPRAVERLSLAGPSGPLEAVVEDSGQAGSRYAVVCHPHPLYGGTMDNKVVTTVARALQELGIPTLRFNFRGVGASAGAYDEGRGETADAAAAASWAEQRWPGRRMVIAGFSFGAYIALRLAGERAADWLITVAPPVDLFDFSHISAPACPWLVVQGDSDDVVDPNKVLAWARSLEPAPRLELLPDVGHFFHGHLRELRDVLIDAIRSG